MFKTIRGKLLYRIIILVVLINIIFTIFITVFLKNTMKNNIIEDMNRAKSFSINIIEQSIIIEESVWKTLNTIKVFTNSYVSITNEYNNIGEYVNKVLDESEIKSILSESNTIKSIIKFKKLKDVYCVTYNYPVYFKDEFYCNLVIQKDYIEKYNDMIKIIGIIIFGQVIVVLTIIVIIYIIIDKITKPIKILSDSMDTFRDSFEEADVVINSDDEVGHLANTYNKMKNKLKCQMDEIVDEKEKVEKLQKLSREFFNNATHELKTPVTAISLYSQILRDNNINDLEDEFIYRATDRMVLESEKMKSLVGKILDVSKGTININKPKVEFILSDLILEILDDFNIRLRNKCMRINKNILTTTYYGVLEDIEQIIINLIDNSVKYAIGNEINIKLYQNAENIAFEISNECSEIPSEIKDRLLEPFIKSNKYDDVSKEISSSGLGLYLCNELAKDNEGSLSYEFEENKIIFKLNLRWKI